MLLGTAEQVIKLGFIAIVIVVELISEFPLVKSYKVKESVRAILGLTMPWMLIPIEK